MKTKVIKYEILREAIRIAFHDDKDIYSLYDPNVKVESLDEIVNNISSKILDYGECKYIGVFENTKLIGYFVYKEDRLISFSINIEYRVRKYLREFFRLIKSEIKGHFNVFLWNINIRAIKYLIKQGMEVTYKNNEITQLLY